MSAGYWPERVGAPGALGRLCRLRFALTARGLIRACFTQEHRTNDWLNADSRVNLDTSRAELQETVAQLMGSLDVTKLHLAEAQQATEAERLNVQRVTRQQQLDKQEYLTALNAAEERARTASRELREAHRQLAEAVGISVLKLSPLRANAQSPEAKEDGRVDAEELREAIKRDERRDGPQAPDAERREEVVPHAL